MSKLQPTKDNRITYDKKTGAVRSFFGAELVKPLSAAKRGLTLTAKADDFLKVNRQLFNLKNINLKKADIRRRCLPVCSLYSAASWYSGLSRIPSSRTKKGRWQCDVGDE